MEGKNVRNKYSTTCFLSVSFPLHSFGEQLSGMDRIRMDARIQDVHIEKRAVTSETLQITPGSGILVEELMSTHQYPFSALCITSIIFGILLATNMLGHLQVATEASGRGVLRCIRLHTWISLGCIPAICGDIALLTGSHKDLPPVLCGSLDVLTLFLWCNNSFRGLSIALSR